MFRNLVCIVLVEERNIRAEDDGRREEIVCTTQIIQVYKHCSYFLMALKTS